jgi:hypothetical protein
MKASRRLLLFRAKITSMGDKIHIIIPRAYHSDAEYFKDRYVSVSVVEILVEPVRVSKPSKP